MSVRMIHTAQLLPQDSSYDHIELQTGAMSCEELLGGFTCAGSNRNHFKLNK